MLSKYCDIGKKELSLTFIETPLQGCYMAVKATLCAFNVRGESREATWG